MLIIHGAIHILFSTREIPIIYIQNNCFCVCSQHEDSSVHPLCDLDGDNAGDSAGVPADLGHVEGPGSAAARLDLPDRRRHLLRHLPETGALLLQPLQWRQGTTKNCVDAASENCNLQGK